MTDQPKPVSELLREELDWPCPEQTEQWANRFPEAVALLERELKAYDDLREELGGKEGPECAAIRAYLAALRKEIDP